ncbi:MAG: hypothetical protein EAY66_09285 [Sphingobacteriales bacterium]|nr:MAG: hypothetical protein EAY66_09285 [Sphingobacteriales bacterium]
MGVGNPEQLKHNLSGFWSRKINQKDKIVYTVKNFLLAIQKIVARKHNRFKFSQVYFNVLR